MNDLEVFLYLVPILLASMTLHELAHAVVATRLGDPTPREQGRLTLNPIVHLDPAGTAMFALTYFLTDLMFGWAKPVPVNFNRLRNPRYGMVLVALAGPAINIVLAFFAAWALRWIDFLPETALLWVQQSLVIAVQINVILAVFNMIPLPPLDGGRLLFALAPRSPGWQKAEYQLDERNIGVAVLLALLLIPLGGPQALLPVLLDTVVGPVVDRVTGG